MAQLVLVLLFLGAVAIAVSATVSVTKALGASANTALGEDMPKTFQRIAYVVLILLMFGVVTGWLGAA